MTVAFDQLRIGDEYERKYLAELWGYAGYEAITGGVIKPTESKFIVLFVTEKKQQSLTQYDDSLDGNQLHWEGENKHGSDRRIIEAFANQEQIHLFHRRRHHTPFRYLGQIELASHRLHIDRPSRFTFNLRNRLTRSANPFDDVQECRQELDALDQTERDAVIKSRVGQGRFRQGLIDLWQSCAVTGLQDHRLLRVSHIKPWRYSTNAERLDPHNGLLLTPALDCLFDRGLISFENSGKVVTSSALRRADSELLGLHAELRLRRAPERTMQFLAYHRGNLLV